MRHLAAHRLCARLLFTFRIVDQKNIKKQEYNCLHAPTFISMGRVASRREGEETDTDQSEG